MHDQEHQNQAEAIETMVVRLIEEVIEGYGLAGMGIGVVSEGEIVFARGFGTRNIVTGEPSSLNRSMFLSNWAWPTC